MRKVLVLTACMLFLLAGWAQADTLVLGGNFTYPIYGLENGTPVTLGGGSVDPSYLDGQALNYVYCVDIFTTVSVPESYPQTIVDNAGLIYGKLVNNAGEVAWLLSQYGDAGQGQQQAALQAAIWTVINGASVYQLDTSLSTPTEIADYNSYLTTLGSNTAPVSELSWITPGTLDSNGKVVQYQGLVASVPEPGTLLLLGSGLIGLAGIARRKFKK